MKKKLVVKDPSISRSNEDNRKWRNVKGGKNVLQPNSIIQVLPFLRETSAPIVIKSVDPELVLLATCKSSRNN